MSVKIKFAYSNETREINGCEKILPCPWCGSDNNLAFTSKENFDTNFKENGGATITISCGNCNCEMYEHSYNGKRYDTKVRVLISKWNERSGEEDDKR